MLLLLSLLQIDKPVKDVFQLSREASGDSVKQFANLARFFLDSHLVDVLSLNVFVLLILTDSFF